MNKYYIAVDFDGTLVKDAFPLIGEENERVIGSISNRIRALREKGYDPQVILWTCRTDWDEKHTYLSDAVRWCKEHLPFPVAYVNENPDCEFGHPELEKKIFAHEYWDDKAYNPYESFPIVVQPEILEDDVLCEEQYVSIPHWFSIFLIVAALLCGISSIVTCVLSKEISLVSYILSVAVNILLICVTAWYLDTEE